MLSLCLVLSAFGLQSFSPQHELQADWRLVHAAQAASYHTTASGLRERSEIAYDRAVIGILSVDPKDGIAVAQVVQDLALSYSTLQFLEKASLAATDGSATAHAADLGDEAAASHTKRQLEESSYHITMALNNLGLLADANAMAVEDDTDDDADNDEDETDNDGAGDTLSPAGPPKTPTTITGPDGTNVPGVPTGATGTTSTTGKGLIYPLLPNTPGLDPRVTQIRIMDATNLYPDGYAVYMNKGGQQGQRTLNC